MPFTSATILADYSRVWMKVIMRLEHFIFDMRRGYSSSGCLEKYTQLLSHASNLNNVMPVYITNFRTII